MKPSLILPGILLIYSTTLSVATAADDKKTTTTTQQAAEAMKRQGQTGTSNESAAKQLERLEKEQAAEKPAPSPTPKEKK